MQTETTQNKYKQNRGGGGDCRIKWIGTITGVVATCLQMSDLSLSSHMSPLLNKKKTQALIVSNERTLSIAQLHPFQSPQCSN